MNSIPEICLQYTSVFKTMRLEMGACLIVGLLVGYYLAKWGDRK